MFFLIDLSSIPACQGWAGLGKGALTGWLVGLLLMPSCQAGWMTVLAKLADPGHQVGRMAEVQFAFQKCSNVQ